MPFSCPRIWRGTCSGAHSLRIGLSGIVKPQQTLGQDPPKFVNTLLGSEVIRIDRVWADNRVSLHFDLHVRVKQKATNARRVQRFLAHKAVIFQWVKLIVRGHFLIE